MLPIRRRKPQIRLQGTAAPEALAAQAVWGTSPAPFLFSECHLAYVSFGPSALQGEFYRSVWRLRAMVRKKGGGMSRIALELLIQEASLFDERPDPQKS